MRTSLRLLITIVVAALAMAASTLALAPQVGNFLTAGDVEPPDVDLEPLAQRSLVFADNGSVLATFHAEENREAIPLKRIPDSVIDTILAVEDESFYSHDGVNLRAGFRALSENVSAGQIEQGGSTITQQLVKNSLLTPDQDLQRKVEEAILAIELEKQLSKDEILERYINQVYFGGGAYGVQAAAELYFGVNARKLDHGQAALLASLISNPVGYDPVNRPKLARQQRRIALDLVVEQGDLTEDEADFFAAAPLPKVRRQVLPKADSYFVEEVKQQLLAMPALGETQAERFNAVFKGGLKISTTFSPSAQRLATEARNANLPDSGGQFSMAVASIDSTNGAVRALIGGPGFENYKFDIATQGKRQPGSSFKIFVLTEALEQDFVPDDQIVGTGPCKFDNPGGTPDPYIANNFGNSGGSNGSITSMTTSSSNCGFLRLGKLIGLNKVIRRAKKMGISTPLDAVLPLSIGSEEVLPIEMAGAAASIANGGMHNEPYYIDRVEAPDGTVLFEHEAAPERAMSQKTACLVTRILEANVQGGTGTAANLLNMPAAGKTGTTENFSDAWFVGFTPYLSTAVWMGAPGSRVPMTSVGGTSVTGGSFPAQVWGAYNQPAHTVVPYKAFPSCSADRKGRDLTSFFKGTDDAEDEGSVCPPRSTPADLDGDGEIESCIIRNSGPRTSAPAPALPPPAPTVPPPTTSPPTSATIP